jgi:hypothetical protein
MMRASKKKVDIYHPTPDEALQFMRQVLLHCDCDFTHEWQGWKLRGRDLVTPGGERINARRLQGLLFVEASRVRIAKVKQAAVPQPSPAAPAIAVPMRRVA